LAEVIIIIIIIIICYGPSDRVKIDRQEIFNQQDTERLIRPIFKTPSLVRAIPVRRSQNKKWELLISPDPP